MSLGQTHSLSIIDRFGIYLSIRMIRNVLKKRLSEKITMLDCGCGYHAHILHAFLPHITQGTAIDLAVSDTIKNLPHIQVHEKPLEQVLPQCDQESFDVICLISVLEHLKDPVAVLMECKRILKKNGMLLINVPTWRGKFFLEFSAFILKTSPQHEMDDHKMYYDKKNLWITLVQAGFKPSMIRSKKHKFGLNLFAICRKEGEGNA